MKILLVGPELVERNDQYVEEKSWSYMKAFERAGLKTAYFAYMLKGRFAFVEKDKHLKKISHSVINKRLLREVRQTRPYILALFKAGPIEADTLWEIRKKTDTIIINIMHDNPIVMGNFSAIAPCHFYFVKDTYVLECLKRIGFKNIYYLPQGTDPHLRKPMQLSAEDTKIFGADLMLMGSRYPYRERFIEDLVSFKPVIWGKEWARTKNPEIIKLYKGRSVWGIDKTKAICGAVICLNPHHPINDIKGTQSRTFDIAACGSFQLAEFKEDIKNLFKIGEEIICYQTIDELKKYIQHYLAHPDERKEISNAGYKRVLKDHTFDNRVRQILDFVNT
ncbi:MAG: glycosyltransferase [Nitrospirota bacterium]